jgi:hypothetical protein
MKNALIGCAALVLFATAPGAGAQGTNPILGQTITTAGNFCPVNWAPMNGQLLAIATYDTLFTLIGTTYGGDGQTTFALPTAEPIVTATGATLTQCISLFGLYPTPN